MRQLLLIVVLLFSTNIIFAQQAFTPDQEQMIDDWQVVYGKISSANDDPKAAIIRYQLVRYTDKQYPVVFAQSFAPGSGHSDEVIIVDYSLIGADRSILAFTFAHEWGHQILVHQPNIHHTSDSGWTYKACALLSEKEADIYAGKFLAIFNYDPKVVYDYLLTFTQPDRHTNSTGKDRAEFVKQGYKSVNVEPTPVQSGVDGAAKQDQLTVKCTHLIHPAGDQIPCSHRTHPAGDLVPCQHACVTASGVLPCHPLGDNVSCSHPLHYSGDRIACTHLLHPTGDIVKDGNYYKSPGR